MIRAYLTGKKQLAYWIYTYVAFSMSFYVAALGAAPLGSDPSLPLALGVDSVIAARFGFVLWRRFGDADARSTRDSIWGSLGRGLETVGDMVPMLKIGVRLRTFYFGALFGAGLALSNALPSPLDRAFVVVAVAAAMSELPWGRRENALDSRRDAARRREARDSHAETPR